MAHKGHLPLEGWVATLEETVKSVDLCNHGVQDSLAVGGAVVEEEVEQSVVGEMPESADTGKSDTLNGPVTGQKCISCHLII